MNIYSDRKEFFNVNPLNLSIKELWKTIQEQCPANSISHQSGYSRKGMGCGVKLGNIPWNRGLKSEDDIRVKNNSNKSAKTLKENGHYNTCGKYLPKLCGDDNHMRRPEHRKRMSELASRRYKITKEDGTWTWGYHPL